jgi:hydroxymethylpyrimidine pyrophosphatase-like HAD family hydrolase
MFAHSRLSIAMGNADPQVKRAARRITDTNNNEGFAKAVERFILAAAATKRGRVNDRSTRR